MAIRCSACSYKGRSEEAWLVHVWASGCLAALNAEQNATTMEAFALWEEGNAEALAAKPHCCLVEGCSFRAKTLEALQAHSQSPAHKAGEEEDTAEPFTCPRCPDKRWWRLDGKGGFANHVESCKAAAEWGAEEEDTAEPFTCPRCPDKRWWRLDGKGGFANHVEACQAAAEWGAEEEDTAEPFTCPRCPDKRWWRLDGKGGFANHVEACQAAAEWVGPAEAFTCPRCPGRRWWARTGKGGFANHIEACIASTEWAAIEKEAAPPPPNVEEVVAAVAAPPPPAAAFPRSGAACGVNQKSRKAHMRGRCPCVAQG